MKVRCAGCNKVGKNWRSSMAPKISELGGLCPSCFGRWYDGTPFTGPGCWEHWGDFWERNKKGNGEQ